MRRQQHSDHIRNRIIDEAARLIVTYGYDGIAMREIADAVGLSKAGLYHHFRDKEELLIAVLTNWSNEIGISRDRRTRTNGTRPANGTGTRLVSASTGTTRLGAVE